LLHCVLQCIVRCVAVRVRAGTCLSVYCSATAANNSALQCVLQFMLQCVLQFQPEGGLVRVSRCVAVCCSVLQCVLQCVLRCGAIRVRASQVSWCVAGRGAVCCSVRCDMFCSMRCNQDEGQPAIVSLVLLQHTWPVYDSGCLLLSRLRQGICPTHPNANLGL